jgi:hypothetical protein
LEFQVSSETWGTRSPSGTFPSMTIAIAWTRRVLDYEQLVFVSDSRISGGEVFDSCPKIMTLPRTDCAIAFAGAAAHAFPMMVQLACAIDSFPKAKRRAHEIKRVCTHALRVFDGMAELLSAEISNAPEDIGVPSAEFLFGATVGERNASRSGRYISTESPNRFRLILHPHLGIPPIPNASVELLPSACRIHMELSLSREIKQRWHIVCYRIAYWTNVRREIHRSTLIWSLLKSFEICSAIHHDHTRLVERHRS